MKHHLFLVLVLLLPLLSACVTVEEEKFPEAIDLGQSADKEACRATRRDDVDVLGGAGAQYDLFCGEWRRAAAIIRVEPTKNTPQQSILDDCKSSDEFGAEQGVILRCPGAQSGKLFQDIALVTTGKSMAVTARGLPGALPAMQRAGAVLTGQEAPVALSEEDLAALPGVQAMQDQELLRKRGHERNISYEFALAAADYAKAVTIQDSLFGGDPTKRADIALDLALNLSNQGRFAEAEKLFDDTSNSLGSQTAAWIQDKIINYRAVHFLNKGDYIAALAEARKPFTPETGAVLSSFVRNASGDLDVITAREAEYVNHRQGKSGPPLYSDAELRPDVRAAILKAHRSYIKAVTLTFLKQPEAGAALDEASSLIMSAPNGSAPWLEALIEEKRGLDELEAGHAATAVAKLKSVLGVWQKREPRSLLSARFLTSLGRAELAAGDEAAALASYNEAFNLYLGVQGSFGVSPDNAGEYLSLLADSINRNGSDSAAQTARYVQAFEAVVEPRAAAAMALASARIGSDTVSEEIRKLQDAERKYGDALQALEAAVGIDDPDKLAKLQADSDAAETEVTAAEATARRANPQYMQLVNRGVATTDVAKTLAPQEALIAFVATQSGGLGYAVFGGKTKVFKTDLTREKAEQLVRRLRATLRSRKAGIPPFALDQAFDLFSGMFGPVFDELKAANIQTIIFAPRGVVGSVPPSILVSAIPADAEAIRNSRDYSSVKFLASDFNFMSAPSAASFVAARRAGPTKAEGTVTVFGPPVAPNDTSAWLEDFTGRMVAEGRPARCGTIFQSERALQQPLTPLAGDVAGRFRRTNVIGASFTDQGIVKDKDLAAQQVLVFVTHGFFGDGFCITEPSLLTSLSRDGGDGLLSATEILDLKLDADLVLLAACDTARSAEDAQGIAAIFDGAQLDGLVRSFIYAGARSVMATHWVADDTAADRIVRRFFASADIKPIDNALRLAQETLIADPGYSHPYFWGPYVVIGDASRPLTHGAARVSSSK